mmetsp:Transcript_8618/g.22679  ORF Transcript_8618/g.22679 Transcript_8618/m.22679 type:complete len:185 (-) Transcript_8618:592-1146(-)
MEKTGTDKSNLERVAIRNLLVESMAPVTPALQDAHPQISPWMATGESPRKQRQSPRTRSPAAVSSGHRERRGVAWSWTKEEDDLLLSLIERFGAASWSRYAAEYFNGQRTGSALRSRYYNNLIPGRDPHRPWSEEEDALLLRRQQEIGNNWVQIAEELPARSGNDAKNRYHVLARAGRSQHHAP